MLYELNDIAKRNYSIVKAVCNANSKEAALMKFRLKLLNYYDTYIEIDLDKITLDHIEEYSDDDIILFEYCE